MACNRLPIFGEKAGEYAPACAGVLAGIVGMAHCCGTSVTTLLIPLKDLADELPSSFRGGGSLSEHPFELDPTLLLPI